ncbi:MAG TPA: hypothetical protein VG164_14245 [Trebonia sp.]|nr:hypothetical protein [Trebonia sp.]
MGRRPGRPTAADASGPWDDPFAALGLSAAAGTTDDDVRGAWRRIAAATHPDRNDGGDPPRFAAAAAAYASLRTPYDRGEVLADLRAAGRGAHTRRIRRTRSGRLGLRVLLAAAAGASAVLAAGWSPGSMGVLAGAATWVIAAAWPR